MTRIVRVDAATAAVPLPAPIGFSSRTVTTREYTLVRVHGDDGSVGLGFCYPGHRAASLATTAVTDLLGPVLLGADADHITGLWDAMYRESLLHGRAGVVVRALSALDIALWDRRARAAGLPLHRFLGATGDRVPAYASGGYYRDGKGPEGLADEFRRYAKLGFRAMKMKIGRLSLSEDTERLAAARDAVGHDVRIMLDANNAFRDLPTAARAMRVWDPYDPYWIEEPFSPDDISNHARLARRTRVPVATGEIEAGRWRHRELLEADAAAILQTDAAVCGGVTEFIRIAHIADSHGITMCPHWFHDLHAPLVAAIPNGQYVEYFPTDEVANLRNIIDRQLTVDDGHLLLHDTPGLGFDLDDDAVETHLAAPWAQLR